MCNNTNYDFVVRGSSSFDCIREANSFDYILEIQKIKEFMI